MATPVKPKPYHVEWEMMAGRLKGVTMSAGFDALDEARFYAAQVERQPDYSSARIYRRSNMVFFTPNNNRDIFAARWIWDDEFVEDGDRNYVAPS